jgi:hypothetical protein
VKLTAKKIISLCESANLNVVFTTSSGKSFTVVEYLRSQFNIKIFDLLRSIKTYNQVTGLIYNQTFFIYYYKPTIKNYRQLEVFFKSFLTNTAAGNRISYSIFRFNKIFGLNLFKIDIDIKVSPVENGVKFTVNPKIKFLALQTPGVRFIWGDSELSPILSQFDDDKNANELQKLLDSLINNKIITNRISDLASLISTFDSYLSDIQSGRVTFTL